MARRLPTTLQIQKIEAQCLKFNDNCDEIDFRSEVDDTLTLGENRANIEANFPHFFWEDPDPEVPVKAYEEMVIAGLQAEAEPYSYDIIKGYKLEALQRDSRKAERLGKKLEICETVSKLPRKTPPGVCARKSVEVRKHLRCKPRK